MPLHSIKKTLNNHARILATASFLNVVLWLVRSIFATYGLSINAFNPNTFNSIIFICIFLVGIFWYFTFIALLYSRATQAEQAALTRFEGMATTLPCALYEYFLHPDYTSEFRYVSPSIKELVGHSAESVMENASLIIGQVHPDDQEYFWKVNLESYNTGKTFFIETRLIVLDGSTKWVQLSSSPRGEDFKNVTWSGYIIDITERKQFQEKANTVDLLTNKNQEISTLLKEKEQLVVSLLKANKTAVTGALSASIAHELNQPIGASNLNIQFLQKKFDQNEMSPALGKQVLSLLARDNHRAANIIRSLQSMFLQDEVIKETCQFDVVLDSVLSIVRPETNKNGISIHIEMSSQVNILINEVDMKQILLNLLNNAIRELSNIEVIQKEILIECTQTLNLTTISISDSGRGISPDRQRNLFELLSHEKNIGMGIGLWLCKYIATRYSGQLRYQVSKLGGANFTITIPS